MYTVLHPCGFITLAVLPWTLCQEPVPIQFQVSPVLVATGGDAVFTLQTISNIFSITWLAPGGGTLGQWIGSQAVLNPLAPYQGRVNISATQLRISTSRLSDAGNYTVTVTPAAPTGLATNSRSVALKVFDAVSPVSLFVPSVAIEGGNVSLSCTWAKGTETSVAWSKGGASLLSDPHISINAGSLIVNPASRTDAGQYSCTVSNPVSAQTATETLTVYYGPDPPQVNKTSSDCVGGGDVMVGQAAQLTCTSVSFPPASLSWQYNGQSLTASQSTSGSLSLQIFSNNQSGKYVCLASNSITTKTSQQELSLSVVGSCLSVGAVAGIVIACFVALVLIIAAIVLLVRQRKADRRLRTVIRQQNKNLNAGPMVISAPQNGHVNPEFTGDQPGPPIHAGLNRPTNQQNAPTIWQNNKENNAAMTQNRATNTSAVQRNNYPNGTTLPNGANPTSGTVPSNGQRNSNLIPRTNSHNPDSFPRNPNIFIQTGGGEPGAQTVLINLNPLNTQPQAVQVSLNAPQSASGQPNQIQPANASQFNLNGIQHERSNRSQQNPPRYPSGRTRTENAHSGPLRNDPQEPSDPYQPPYFTNQTPTSRHAGTAYTHAEPLHANQTRSRADYRLDADAEPRQMPWDRMRGTPAYPNFQVESDRDSSQTSTSQDRSPDSERRRTASTQRRRRSADGQVRNIPRASRRDLLRQLAQSAAHRRTRTDQSAPRQAIQPRAAGPPPQQIQNPLVQTGTNPTMAAPQTTITPQRQTVQTQTSEPTNIANRASPGQRDSAPPNDYPNLVPLTQAALRQHTSQTPSPFLSRIHQTQAALQHPGTQPRNAETLPAGQINRQGQAAPTLPLVLQPNEFRTLPREPLQKPPTQQPVLVMKRPGVVHHGHRPPNMHRNARTMQANLHMHPGNLHKQMNVPRHPAHTVGQIHRSRPKP